MSEIHSLFSFLGSLSAVIDLNISSQNSFVFLNWTAPFSLDISRTQDGITYTVGVVNPASLLILHMENGVTLTEFWYPLPPASSCDDLVFTVIPVNEAGEGISLPNSIPLSQALECKSLIKLGTEWVEISFLTLWAIVKWMQYSLIPPGPLFNVCSERAWYAITHDPTELFKSIVTKLVVNIMHAH